MSQQIAIRRAMSASAKVLIARQGIIHFFSLFASVILARLLTPQDFGVYAIVGFFLRFMTLLSDGGIGASLVQSEREFDRETYSAVFTIIQMLYLGACVVAIPGALLFTYFYRSMSLDIWMIYTFVIEFYLSSFRVIPAAKLERTLNYTKLAWVETSEFFSFQVVTVILALMGNGVWSFIFGALVSRVVGLILLYVFSPFFPKVSLNLETVRPLMRFGIKLQMANMVSFIENSLSPSFLAFKLGTAVIGFANFANKVGSYPTYPLKVVDRMMFPFFSRLQENEEDFWRTLNDMIRIYNIVLFGTTSVLLSALPETVRIVFGDKWMHSTELIYSVLIGRLFLGYASPISAVIQAKGRGGVFLVTNSLDALLSWGIAVPSILFFGYNGLVVLNLTRLIQFPISIAIVRKRMNIRIHFWSSLWRPTCGLVATYAMQRILLNGVRPHALLSLVACLLVGVLLYTTCILILDRTTRNWALDKFLKFRIPRWWLRNSED